MTYKSKITMLFFVELIRSIIGFPDFIAIISLCLAFTLIKKNFILYAIYFVVFFFVRYLLNFELNNFNFLLSSLILLFPNDKVHNFKFVNYSLVLFILIPIFFGFGNKIRQSGLGISTFMESANSFLLLNFFAFFIYFYKNNKTNYLNLLILIGNQSKLAISLILIFIKSWRSIILTSICIIVLYFYFFSSLFPRFEFFIKNRGIVFSLFSGRFERLVQNFDLNHISLFGSLGGTENFEIEPINILFQLGIINLIIMSILIYKKLKNSILSFKSKVLLMLPLILTGHFLENTIVVILFHFITENNEKK